MGTKSQIGQNQLGRSGSVLIAAVVIGAALLACKNKAPGGSESKPAAGEQPGCVKYEPAKISGKQAGTWKAREDEQVVALNVSDPGGGLLKVVVGVGGTATAVDFRVKGQTAQNHANVGAGSEKQASLVFRVQGSTEYELILKPFVGPGSGDNSYDVSWSYEPLVDCYEQNDTKEAARQIKLGETIQAYAHAGIIAGDGARSGPGLVDFYKFELAEKSKLRMVVTKPDDSALSFELLDAQDATQASIDPVGVGGSELVTDEVDLAPGTYWVHVAAFSGQDASQDAKEPIPAGWNRPYKLSVQIR